MSVRIIGVNRISDDGENPFEAITELSWINEKTQEKGVTSRVEMYNWIKDRGGEAYVQITPGSSISRLGTAVSSRGVKYVRTYSNGVWNDELLQLPKC